MILLRKLLTELTLSSCRDLRDVTTGAPISSCLVLPSQALEMSQNTSRGVMLRMSKESMINMEFKLRCVRLSHRISIPNKVMDERQALSKRGQFSSWKFIEGLEQWDRMNLSIGDVKVKIGPTGRMLINDIGQSGECFSFVSWKDANG